MPMARYPIVRRRPCDSEISKAYGAKRAATHSPSAERPGKISDALGRGFESLGYGLWASSPARELIEVYPHAALIEFLSAPLRLEYKAAKIGRYWPELSAIERHARLRCVWSCFVEALERRISGVAHALPPPAPETRGWRLKAYEDKLDAVVCVAVAIAYLDGKARAYGDEDAAIWVPIGEAGGCIGA